MKKVLTLLLCTCFAAFSFAATATVDGITWTYTVSNGEASIYKSSYYSAIPSSTRGAITIPSTLGGCPVTTIGDDAFYNCSGLTSVTIPSSVTSIGDDAFYNCTKLTSITIPSSVTSIGHSAFEACSSLYKDVNGVQYESEAKIVLIDVPTSLSGSFEIPSSIRFIYSEAFEDCSGLTSVRIPSSVTSIGDWAFGDCTSLTSVTIPSSVTSIGDWAFSGCGKLKCVYTDDIGAWVRIQFSNSSANPLYYADEGLYLNGEKTNVGDDSRRRDIHWELCV